MQLIPPWFETLLSTSFFSVCDAHKDAPRSECNMFCLDCKSDSFCFYCRYSKHEDHSVIQIRRSSYHEVVRVAEIQDAMDVTGVQTYVINSARVVFINERPQTKSGVCNSKVNSQFCEVCGRSILERSRFCSLACKVVKTKKNEDANFGNLWDKKKKMEHRLPFKKRRLRLEEDDEEEKMYKPNSNLRKRKRKGIPHRAPFY